MQIRFIKRKVEPFDAGFPVYQRVLQHLVAVHEVDGTTGLSWEDVPCVEEETI